MILVAVRTFSGVEGGISMVEMDDDGLAEEEALSEVTLGR